MHIPILHLPYMKPTTPTQWKVIAWALIVGLSLMGLVCLWLAWHAPADKAQAANSLQWWGVGFLAAAVVVWLLKRLAKWFWDR